MEDVHRTLLNLNSAPPGKRLSFFAVYDGHGGVTSAVYSGATLHLKIAAEKAFREGNYPEAIRRGFLAADQDLHMHVDRACDQSGCTAVIALLTDDWRIIVGNAGDSRAVLSYSGIAVPLSYDHKPMNIEESRRIMAGGGYIENNRVNGNLALSRAMGDFRFKDNDKLSPEAQIITANPDIIERTLLDEDEFIVIACDGIWDCMSNQGVVDFVRRGIISGKGLDSICEEIMDDCVADNIENCDHGHDNMTIIIIGLLNNQPETVWREKIQNRPSFTSSPGSSSSTIPAEELPPIQITRNLEQIPQQKIEPSSQTQCHSSIQNPVSPEIAVADSVEFGSHPAAPAPAPDIRRDCVKSTI